MADEDFAPQIGREQLELHDAVRRGDVVIRPNANADKGAVIGMHACAASTLLEACGASRTPPHKLAEKPHGPGRSTQE